MIPIRLELEAFLPFKEKQTLDFTLIQQNRMFLVTGNTGAGKTSIFDAICFALFGQASGSQRAADNIKSQFAADDVTAYVSFTFENKGSTYQILRTPLQLRRKRTGNLSQEKASAILTLEDGRVISGIRQVDAKIEEIIGLNAEQFKKIVMLPQGEFLKFLNDNSTRKQEILQKIFGTQLFEAFTEQLKQKNVALSGRVDGLKNKRDTQLSALETCGDEALMQQLAKEFRDYPLILKLTENLNTKLEESAVQAKRQVDKVTKQKYSINLESAKHTNQRLTLLKQLKVEMEALKNREDEIHAKKEQVKKLYQIQECKNIYENCQQVSWQISQTKEQLCIDRKCLEQRAEKFLSLQNSFEDQLKINRELPKIAQKITVKENNFTVISNLKQEKHKLQLNRIELERCQQAQEYRKLQQKAESAYQNLKQLESLLVLLQQTQQQGESYLKNSDKYQAAFQKFIKNQAALLSAQLAENKPCPVCGSLSHPHPTKQHPEATCTQQELDNLKIASEVSEASFRKLQSRLSEQFLLLHQSGFDTLSQEEPYLSTLEQLTQRITLQKQELLQIKKQWSSCSPLCGDASSMTEEALLARISHLQAGQELILQQIQHFETEITQKGLDEQSLHAEIAALKQKIVREQQAFDRISREKEEASSEYDTIRETVRQKSGLVEQYQQRYTELESSFQALLLENNIDLSEFHTLSGQFALLDELQSQITAYDRSVIVTEQKIAALSTELEGKEFCDIEKLEEQDRLLASQLAELNKQYQSAANALYTNHKVLSGLQKDQDSLASLSGQYDEINRLYQMASGKNSGKISFERYVLGVYFDQVVKHANLRLVQMTNSRYQLRRREEKGKGNVSSGLDLEIFDAYSGKYRSVHTLSGGESFKTALCLALGLADVITQTSGGVEINTIFIDEGFGTLDHEALECAVDCLYDMKDKGRMIGIISHVSELKEMIPAKLCVIQTKNGSHAQFELM